MGSTTGTVKSNRDRIPLMQSAQAFAALAPHSLRAVRAVARSDFLAMGVSQPAHQLLKRARAFS